MQESAIPYLREVLVFLAAVVVIIPLFHRLKISPLLGYLAVGAAVGPYGLGFVTDVKGVASLAGLGVIFLLFTIGLDLSLSRLWGMRRLVFGLGTAQIVVTAAVIAGIAYLWGNTARVAIVLGAALALSSTAMVMQLLTERGEIATRHGRTVFAVLLMQDLAVVPLLFLLTLLSHPDDRDLSLALLIALTRSVLAIVGIIVVGRLVVRPLFRLVAGTRSSELFLALTLLGILGLAWATGELGMTGALGAFLAGLLVAETEFRPQVEGDIRPFRGLLLGLFFISVGMSLDLTMAFHSAGWVIAAVIGLILLKGMLAAVLALAFGRPVREAVRSGILLGQAGEFAFIVIGAALNSNLMMSQAAQFMAVTVGLSMAATPFLPHLADLICGMLPPVRERDAEPLPESRLEHHVVIAGFGRVGQTVARLLAAQNVAYIGLETDADIVERMRQCGEPVFFGNPTQHNVLERLGGDRALAIAITIDDSDATLSMMREIRARWPRLPVYARARDIAGAHALERLGATGAVPETEEASLQLGAEILLAIGFPPHAVNASVEAARRDIDATDTEAPLPHAAADL